MPVKRKPKKKTPPSSSRRGLSLKHKTFIDIYFSNGQDTTKAYVQAGYKPSSSCLTPLSRALLKKLSKTDYFLKKHDEFVQKNVDLCQKRIKMFEELFNDALKGDKVKDSSGRILYTKRDRKTAHACLDSICKIEGHYAETRMKLQRLAEGDDKGKGDKKFSWETEEADDELEQEAT